MITVDVRDIIFAVLDEVDAEVDDIREKFTEFMNTFTDEKMTELVKDKAREIIEEEYSINSYIAEIIEGFEVNLERNGSIIDFKITNNVSGAIETDWAKTNNHWEYELQDYLTNIDKGMAPYQIPQNPVGEVLAIGSKGGSGGFPYNHQKGAKPVTVSGKPGTDVRQRLDDFMNGIMGGGFGDVDSGLSSLIENLNDVVEILETNR